MALNVKKEYLDRVKKEIGEDKYKLYLDSLADKETHGFTLNLYKLNKSNIDLEFVLKRFDGKIIFKNNNFAYIVYDKDELAKKEIYVGKDPLHHAGLYYIQEPSAAMVLKDVQINPNDIILDMCASPGGKSIEALYSLKKEEGGYLVANEKVYGRVKALYSNIERMGFENVAITCEDSKRLRGNFANYFDKIIVDAPCSGEGMFRKSEEAREQWSESLVKTCANVQRELVEDAYYMLKNGGVLIYSTCTFSKDEDEDIISYIVDKFNDMAIVKMEKIWPYMDIGEGQFYSILKKDGDDTSRNIVPSIKDFKGLNLIKYGLDTYEKGKKDVIPTHASSHMDDIEFENTIELNDDEINKYLKGETINKEQDFKGFCKITYKGIGIGIAKCVNGVIKNHYPKGLRNL